MSSPATSVTEVPGSGVHVPHLAAQWRAVRRLYPIYVALATQFGLGIPPYENLDDAGLSEPELVEQVERWFTEMDPRIQVHHLRQLLQNAGIAASEEKLHGLIDRHLSKPELSETDHDKLDFLLVQYFAVCSPPSFQDREVQVDEVAEVLEPVVGRCILPLPEWLGPLQTWVEAMRDCRSLREMQDSGIVKQGHQLRVAARGKGLGPDILVAFTRFSYLLRRTFFHLINSDLKTVELALDQLEARGVSVLDCSAAQLSVATSIQELRRLCRNYKKPVVPDYSVDVSITRLIALREVTERALAEAMLGSRSLAEELGAQLEERISRLEQELLELRKLAAELVAAASGVQPMPAEMPIAAPTSIAEPESVSASIAAPASEPVKAAVAEPVAPPPPPPVPAVAAPVAAAPAPTLPNLNAAVEEIRKKLASGSRRGISSISVAGTALPLSADEVDAFTRQGGDETVALDLQRSLAARAVLILAMEKRRRTGTESGLKQVIEMCRVEAEAIQQHAAEKKQPALALSANQLMMLLNQAGRMTANGG